MVCHGPEAVDLASLDDVKGLEAPNASLGESSQPGMAASSTTSESRSLSQSSSLTRRSPSSLTGLPLSQSAIARSEKPASRENSFRLAQRIVQVERSKPGARRVLRDDVAVRRSPINPDYSHPCIQRLFCSPFAWWRTKGVIEAHTAPFPLQEFTALFPPSRDPKTCQTHGEHGVGGRGATARLTAKKWSRCGQLADSRTITRRARVMTSAATLINRVRHVQANPSPSGSRSRRLLKNRLRCGTSIAAVGSSAGSPNSAARRRRQDDSMPEPHQQVQRSGMKI